MIYLFAEYRFYFLTQWGKQMNKKNTLYGFGDATYQSVGEYEGLVKLVDDFYDAMDALPEAQKIRSMHRDDLSESRSKLVYFLSGWMNGPDIYQDNYGSINIPKAHAHLKVGEEERDAWLLCMKVALEKQPYPEELKNYLLDQLAKPAEMIRRVSQSEQQKTAEK